jgi:DNA-binding CsgD family transcriptional regulator
MLKQVTDIVDAIGKDEFCDSLSRFCEESVEAAEVALFYFPANDNPQCLSTDVKVHEAVVEYIEGAYRFDANLEGLRSKLDEDNEFAIGSLHMNQIKDSGYSSKFYERTGVEKKLSLVAQIESGFVYGNFYRRPNQPDFDAQDEQKLQSIWKLCLSCFKQHARIASISVPDFTDRQARLAVVRKFLRVEGLSKREADVSSHVVMGYSTTAIALHLNIAENTVSTLRRRAYEKLGISSQNQLFEICFRRINDVMRGKPDEHYDRFIKEGSIAL